MTMPSLPQQNVPIATESCGNGNNLHFMLPGQKTLPMPPLPQQPTPLHHAAIKVLLLYCFWSKIHHCSRCQYQTPAYTYARTTNTATAPHGNIHFLFYPASIRAKDAATSWCTYSVMPMTQILTVPCHMQQHCKQCWQCYSCQCQCHWTIQNANTIGCQHLCQCHTSWLLLLFVSFMAE